MKKTAALGTAAFLLVANNPSFANEFIDEAGAEFVFDASIPDFDGGTAIAFKASKNMEDIADGFSVEAEFTKSLSGPSVSEEDIFYSVDAEVSYFTLGAFGKFTHPLNDQFSIFGRAGLAYSSTDLDISVSSFGVTESASGSGTSISLSYGFGATYAFSDTMSITASYSLYNLEVDSGDLGVGSDDVTHLGIGVSMLFD